MPMISRPNPNPLLPTPRFTFFLSQQIHYTRCSQRTNTLSGRFIYSYNGQERRECNYNGVFVHYQRLSIQNTAWHIVCAQYISAAVILGQASGLQPTRVCWRFKKFVYDVRSGVRGVLGARTVSRASVLHTEKAARINGLLGSLILLPCFL